jgi:hypothetical protein
VELTQNGANIDWNVIVFQIDGAHDLSPLSTSMTGTLVGYTAGAATEARIGQSGLLNGTAVGHLTIASSQGSYASSGAAIVGWAEETADSRIFRLASEEGIAAYPVTTSTQEMGVQSRSNAGGPAAGGGGRRRGHPVRGPLLPGVPVP